ncbi:MAG: hypothetical protein JWP27_2597 [Flaviaesturariibacter sp.]|nr:hypothetical protein [Flaviaesturariibacter sp.]
MKKVNVSSPYKRVDIDFANPALPKAVRMLRPTLYLSRGGYCCLLGPDPLSGVFGQGDTPAAALADWEKSFRELQAKGRILQARYEQLRRPAALYVAWKKTAN